MPRTVITKQNIQENIELAIKHALEKPGADVREVAREAALATAPKPDDYLTRVAKYIPSEIILVYLTMERIAYTNHLDPSGTHKSHTILWLIFVFCLVANPCYLYIVRNVTKIQQIIISTLAFAVWVISLGVPFEHILDQKYRALVLPAYTLVAGILVGGGRKLSNVKVVDG